MNYKSDKVGQYITHTHLHVHTHKMYIIFIIQYIRIMLLLSSLPLKSGVRLTSILGINFCFPSHPVTVPISLLSPLPVTTPPSLAVILHSPPNPAKSVFPRPSRSTSSPSALHPEHIGSLC